MADLLEGITWLGHASFRIETPEAVIYIDPWKLKDGEAADLILITHGHHDHFSPDDLNKIRKQDTTVVGVADEHDVALGRLELAGQVVQIGGLAGVDVVPVEAEVDDGDREIAATGWVLEGVRRRQGVGVAGRDVVLGLHGRRRGRRLLDVPLAASG